MAVEHSFRVGRLLGNRHVQTLGAALPMHVKTPETARRERMSIPIPRGGRLLAEAYLQPTNVPLAIVLVHGVGGSSESRYMLRAAQAFFAAGHHVLRLNMRGAGASFDSALELSHAGMIEDPALAVAHAASLPGVERVALVGFSLGGNVSLKLAASWGANPPPWMHRVVSISAPLDLARSSRAFETPAMLPYRAYVLAGLREQARRFAAARPERARYRVDALDAIRTVREYDEMVVAPMHGFFDAAEYYAASSAGPGLPDIHVPTLMLHADDDPMVPLGTLSPWIDRASKAVTVERTARGGHVGWFARLDRHAFERTWPIERALASIGAGA
jgi:predicted alpha/beta-fold hydrolase